MSYYSQVGAVIGGEPETVKKFVQEIKAQDSYENSVLKSFRLLNLKPDLTIYCFYSKRVIWYEEEADWFDAIALAERYGLSWALSRTGESDTDAESDNNWMTLREKFGCKIDDLFEIHHEVVITAPKVQRLFEQCT